MTPQQKAREIAKLIVKTFFKDDYGNAYQLTDGQADIFNIIFTRFHPRNQVIAPRQFGKSDVISMALIIRSMMYRENWAIVAGQMDKAMIIMGRVIQHTFDSQLFYRQLDLDPGLGLDRLRRERSKDHITWRDGGSIKVFTANTTNKSKTKEALTGFGAPNIIEDEASLIPNDSHAMVLSMLGGHKDNFLLKIGNPFYRNHFLSSWQSDDYHKVFIDYKRALAEGRYTEEYLKEMQSLPFYDVLYECKFPESDSLLTGDYRQLITDELLESAWISADDAVALIEGNPKLGVDLGGGGDRSTGVLRWPKVMRLSFANQISDTMQQIPIIQDLKEKHNIEDSDIALDYGGLGRGVGDRLKEVDGYENVRCVMFGGAAPESKKYKNMRAYMYWHLYMWLRDGGRIVKDDSFYELLSVNYKEDSERRFIIQPKEELKVVAKQLGLNITSPDIADAAALTFADNSYIIQPEDFDFI